MSFRANVAIVLGGIAVAALAFLLPPSLSPFKDDTLTLRTRPIPVLPPHDHESTDANVDSILEKGHGAFVESDRYIVPEDLWITEVEVIVENAPRSALHHLILMRAGAPNEECPNWDQEVYTVGADTMGDSTFAKPYGMFLSKGEELYLIGMVHNPLPPKGEGGTHEQVAIGFRLTVERPSRERTRNVEFHRVALQDRPYCKDPALFNEVDVFSVPPNAASFVKESDDASGVNPTRFLITKPGTVMGFGAHIHAADGGKELSIYRNGELLKSVIPEQVPPNPWEWRMSTKGMAAFPVVPGDVITVSTIYENHHDVPIEDAMAQAAIFFAPDPLP